MNLDELQSIRDRERQSDSLQQLRESFYEDVAAFIQAMREEREAAAAESDDPFSDPAVTRLTDDIETAEQTVEDIYDRRVGKLVKMASFAAADMPTEDEGLTEEERALFEELVAAIEANRRRVFAVLNGEDAPTAAEGGLGDDSAPITDDDMDSGTARDESGPETGVDASALMGEETPDGAGSEEEDADAGGDGRTAVPPDDPPPELAGEDADGASDTERDRSSEADEGEDVPRATVRITEDIGEILGVDEREYDLSAEDVVTLPTANAEPLLDRDAAERLE
ncbi:MAG: hypothetical protein ABEJ30_03860 [Halorientalis sp.]